MGLSVNNDGQLIITRNGNSETFTTIVIDDDLENNDGNGICILDQNVGIGTTNANGANAVIGNTASLAVGNIKTNSIITNGDVGIGTDNPTGTNAVNGNTATLAVGTLKANTITGNITGASSFTVENKTSQYTILEQNGDVGKFITVDNAGERFLINASTNFTAGQTVTLHNKSSGNVPIRREGTGVTLRFSGSALEGNRELTQRGIATIICIADKEYIISGSGLI